MSARNSTHDSLLSAVPFVYGWPTVRVHGLAGLQGGKRRPNWQDFTATFQREKIDRKRANQYLFTNIFYRLLIPANGW
jgi:hypothetical protein